MWKEFRERELPRHVAFLCRAIGREVPVAIDWRSLGEEPRRAEVLAYDLEMLGRGIEGLDSHGPIRDESLAVEPGLLARGIERVSLRRVDRPERARLVLRDGTLCVDFLWSHTGSFTAREVETLLLDREGRLVREWVEPAAGALSPEFDEIRRNRLPARVRCLHAALRREIRLEFDWPSLVGAPDSPSRLLHLLDEAIAALRDLAREEPGMVVGPESVHERARREAEERSLAVREGIASVRVSGGLLSGSEACSLRVDRLELRVFQDTEFAPDGCGGAPRPVKYFGHLPGCSARGIREVLSVALDLEAGPLLRRVRSRDVPHADAHLRTHLDGLIGDGRGLSLRDRMRLRKRLAAEGLRLEVDWDSIAPPMPVEDRLACLRKLETGHYNYNCDYGALFKELFFALEEAFSRTASFAEGLLGVVRRIRYVHVPDPGLREVAGEGDTVFVRQCLLEPGGEFGDYAELATRLLAAVDSMTGSSVPVVPIEGSTRVTTAFGGSLEVRIEAGLYENDAEADDLRAVRAEIAELERTGHESWERMLYDRFGRELPLEVDWDSFLAQAGESGKPLHPQYVAESGVMRLVTALNGWMDQDAGFRARARERLSGLLVTSASDAASASIDLDGAVVVYRCHADMSLEGYLTIDDLQMRLGELLL